MTLTEAAPKLYPAKPMTGHTVEIREFLASHGPQTTTAIAARLRVSIETVAQTMHRLSGYRAIRKISDCKKGPGGQGAVWSLRCHH